MTNNDNVREFVNTKVRPAIEKIYAKEEKTIDEFKLRGGLSGYHEDAFIVSIRFEVFDKFERPNGAESWIIGYGDNVVTYMIVDPDKVEMKLLDQLLTGGLKWDGVLYV